MVNQLDNNNAFGDMARTISTLANQWKALGNNMKELGQWLGAIFIPILTKIVTWLNGVASALTIVIKSIAIMLGYNGLSGVTSGFSALDDETEEVTDNINDANDSIKKMKSSLLGIDELNVLSVDDSSSDTDDDDLLGGSIDPAITKALEEAEQKMKAFDDYMADMESKAMNIRNSFLEWLGFEQDEDGINWTLGDGYTKLEMIRDILVVIGALQIWGLLKKFASTDLFKGILSGVTGAASGIKDFGSALIGTFKGSSAAASALTFMIYKIVGAIGVVAGAVGVLSGVFAMFTEESGKKLNHLSTVAIGMGAVVMGIGAIIASPFLIGIGAIVAVVGLFWDELVLITGTILSGASYVVSSIVYLVGEMVRKVAEKVVSLTARIKYIFQSWDIKSVILRIVASILESIQNKLNDFVNTPGIKQILKLMNGGEEVQFTFGTNFSNDINEKTNSKSYDEIYEEVYKNSGLMSAANSINDVALSINDFAGALLDNNWNDYKDKKEEDGIFSALNRLVGDVSGLADAWDLSGLTTKQDDELEMTDDMYSQITQSGDTQEDIDDKVKYANALNKKGLEFDAKTINELSDLQKEMGYSADDIVKALGNIKLNSSQSISSQVSSNLSSGGSASLVDSVGKTISDYSKDYYTALEKGDAAGMKAANDAANAIRAAANETAQVASTAIAAVEAASRTKKTSTHANGGFPAVRGTFVYNEGNNAELLGSINGRTAVVNNQQIVSSVASGVASAVSTVLSQNASTGGSSSGNSKLTATIKGKDLLFVVEQAKSSVGKTTVSNNLAKI